MPELILCIGPQWKGSNAGGLFRAFSRSGHIISIIDEFYFMPLNSSSLVTRINSRVFRSSYIRDFNNEIIHQFKIFDPTIILVYKGPFVLPSTLNELKRISKCKIINFYPDVSFHTHGNFLKSTLPLYDHIFTTKSFGLKDLNQQLGIQKASYIPHGFDPDAHKPLFETNGKYKYDVSFIGTWSADKEKKLSMLKESIPDINLAIFGSQWEKSKSESIRESVKGYPLTGDQYATAIQQSKVNLGLLSEKVKGASAGDQITSRTFHIPACGGFMVHQRTDELLENYLDGREIATFSDELELVKKVQYYLNNGEEREKITANGHKRALADHSLDTRANIILKKIQDEI